jgi:two-component system phosphate regulon sensor histidine kinase PhoR
VVKAAVHEIQPLCSRPDQIHFELESDLEILGIESELYSLCINLLSNALRYSPEGNPIEVSLKPYKDRLRLTVTDHGFGIAPVHLNRLTERFYRVDLAGSRTRGGTGLGLAIVKHVLLRHDSRLQIRSALGQGSSFICDFQPTEKNPDHLP